jgi:ABC-type polysaccharide/polyol phosphate export permease
MKRDVAPLLESVKIEVRVITALFLREILTRFGRHNIGFLWMFVEPMMFTLGVTALWYATGASHGSNLPIAAFALTGYSSVLLWRNMPGRCIGAVQPNLSLMVHRNVKIIDIFAARLILEAAGATMSFTILSVAFIMLGQIKPPEDVLQVIGGWLMIAWFGASLGMLLGATAEESEVVEKLWHPASYLLFPLSGAAFLVDILPKAGQDFVLYLPMVHGTEYLREGYFGTSFVAHYDMSYMATCNIILSLLALAQTRRASRNVIPA